HRGLQLDPLWNGPAVQQLDRHRSSDAPDRRGVRHGSAVEALDRQLLLEELVRVRADDRHERLARRLERVHDCVVGARRPDAVTRWSTEMILTPFAAACAITPFSALGLAGLMMIAFAPAEMRLRMSAIWPAGSVSRFARTTFETLPLTSASALIEQIISSRQPLLMCVFETPRTNLPALPEPERAVAVAATAMAAAARAVTTIPNRIARRRRPPWGRTVMHALLSRCAEAPVSGTARSSLGESPPFS